MFSSFLFTTGSDNKTVWTFASGSLGGGGLASSVPSAPFRRMKIRSVNSSSLRTAKQTNQLALSSDGSGSASSQLPAPFVLLCSFFFSGVSLRSLCSNPVNLEQRLPPSPPRYYCELTDTHWRIEQSARDTTIRKIKRTLNSELLLRHSPYLPGSARSHGWRFKKFIILNPDERKTSRA